MNIHDPLDVLLIFALILICIIGYIWKILIVSRISKKIVKNLLDMVRKPVMKDIEILKNFISEYREYRRNIKKEALSDESPVINEKKDNNR